MRATLWMDHFIVIIFFLGGGGGGKGLGKLFRGRIFVRLVYVQELFFTFGFFAVHDFFLYFCSAGIL